ncbi:Mbov_0396 family ICE element transmembrane protein [Mycoplasma sp. CSL7503-lung]|uniref:Mbov_0396 family ICE element transmembrane protein n=1 Tax=Mycoplasma sp. CSL7503-lung TaxID=536372 RepID=UPI0021D2C4F0|nr:hypothetical protein [Mycoplasma sp. CSL7503-lung]MCU4706434.1 hypothetical protein [Mycoplasma sp. CSL7503-lung]
MSVILEPLIGILAKWVVGYPIYIILSSILLVLLVISSTLIQMIYTLCYEFPNYLIFGSFGTYNKNESLINVPSVWYQFLIVSIILWVIMFALIIIRFSVNSSERGVAIIKSAASTALKGVFLLMLIQALLFGLNYIVLNITNILTGDEVGNSVVYINTFIAIIANSGKADDSWNEVIKASENSNWSSVFNSFNPSNYSVYYSNIGGSLIGMIVSMAIAILCSIWVTQVMIQVIFDIITKLFHLLVLFVTFPFIVPWSLGDNGKKIMIWKDDYLGALLSLSIYLIGLKLLFLFIATGNSFFNRDIKINDKADEINKAKNFVVNTYNGLVSSIMKGFFMAGAFHAYKTLSQFVIKYVGTELSYNRQTGRVRNPFRAENRARIVDATNKAKFDAANKHFNNNFEGFSSLGEGQKNQMINNFINDGNVKKRSLITRVPKNIFKSFIKGGRR